MFRTLEGQNAPGLKFLPTTDLEPRILRRLPWECVLIHTMSISSACGQHPYHPQGGPANCLRTQHGIYDLVIPIAIPQGQPLNPYRRNLIDLTMKIYVSIELFDPAVHPGQPIRMHSASRRRCTTFGIAVSNGSTRRISPAYTWRSNGDFVLVTASELEHESSTPPPGTERRVGLVILSAFQTSETPKRKATQPRVPACLAGRYRFGHAIPDRPDNLSDF